MNKINIVLILVLTINGIAFASYSEAVKLFQDKRYDEAIKVCADSLDVENDMKEGSQNYNIRFLAAHIHWKLKNTNSVIAHFKRCMDINKNSIDPYIDLGLFLIENNRYNDAVKVLNDGLNIKKDAMIYYALGKVQYMKGNYWKAKSYFEMANSINPELYSSYNALGITLMKLKKYGEANTAFLVAHAMRRLSPEILNNVGLSLEKISKNKQAYEYYQKAYEINNENDVIKENIQRIKEKLKE